MMHFCWLTGNLRKRGHNLTLKYNFAEPSVSVKFRKKKLKHIEKSLENLENPSKVHLNRKPILLKILLEA